MTGAAFFDLDKTLLSTSATLAFGRAFLRAGVVPPAHALRVAARGAVYRRFGASEGAIERARDDVADFIRGLPEDALVSVVNECIDRVIPPLVYPAGLEIIRQHKAAGREVVIASSSGVEVVSPIATLLGVEHVIATQSEIREGRYTGHVPFFAFADAKARAIVELAEESGWDLTESYGYSDSHTDLPMLRAVGHPYAVNPDRTLRGEAVRREWPILEFQIPGHSRRSRLGHLIAAPTSLRRPRPRGEPQPR